MYAKRGNVKITKIVSDLCDAIVESQSIAIVQSRSQNRVKATCFVKG